MATLDSIQASFDRFERDQKTRDDGLRQAFGMLITEIKHVQNLLRELLAEATREVSTSSELQASVDRIRDLLETHADKTSLMVGEHEGDDDWEPEPRR